ncbi:hypothetical protein RND81_08G125000 [Saponaria officinalis]|uniref:Bifunctional inhibitor/plant lipid transfer protein/seed storage helical domain-containing protein n=1 Tax=Saponaria officinalis TaxID=3572 RepID=A0AAW1J6K8_SAPOF
MSIKAVVLVMVVAMAWLGVPTTAAKSTSSAPAPACLSSISNSCNIKDGGDTTAQLDLCCAALSNAIENQIKCFCLLKPYLDDPSSADSIATLFNYCSIKGSFDTLCPSADDGSTSPADDTTVTTPTDDGTTPASDDTSTTSTVPSTTSSGSNTGGSLGGGLLAAGGKKNAGNKATTTSLSGLLIISIGLVILREI